jgi:hypothetical protein
MLVKRVLGGDADTIDPQNPRRTAKDVFLEVQFQRVFRAACRTGRLLPARARAVNLNTVRRNFRERDDGQ